MAHTQSYVRSVCRYTVSVKLTNKRGSAYRVTSVSICSSIGLSGQLETNQRALRDLGVTPDILNNRPLAVDTRSTEDRGNALLSDIGTVVGSIDCETAKDVKDARVAAQKID